MRKYFGGAALAIMLVSIAGVAQADVDPSRVATGYADGYVGTDGQFHAWEHRSDAENFRAQHADKYKAWRHDDPRHKSDR